MKHVTIGGVGALGSHVAQFLRNEDIRIKVIDFDRVDQKNTLAQFHSRPSIGRNKAEALKQALQFQWGNKIDAVPHRLTRDNVEQLLAGADLVIDCFDNGASRRLLQDWACGIVDDGGDVVQVGTIAGIPSFSTERAVLSTARPALLHGALAPNGDFARIDWSPRFTIDDEAEAGAPTCEGGEFLPFIAIAAAYLARTAQLFLREGKKVRFCVHPNGVERI